MKQLQTRVDPLAWHFAQLMHELAAVPSQALFLGALVASLASREQHACAELPRYARQPVVDTEQSPEDLLLKKSHGPPVFYPANGYWQQALRRHDDVVGVPGEYKPLILEGDKLYLYRYWDYEQRLAQAIRERLTPMTTEQDSPPEPDAALKGRIEELFPLKDKIDWQAVAAATALDHRFHVISGGPGTGKTTTVSRMVALLLTREPHLKIVLAAPTGKAATRMKESLLKSLDSLHLPEGLPFPTEALTLHRLLGYVAGQNRFRHHARNPLPWDMVIVDEASMIDLAMMTQLLEALAPHTRLVLLGDQYQLASVEAGSVLGDICKAARSQAFSAQRQQNLLDLSVIRHEHQQQLELTEHSLDNHVVLLSHSYRFAADKGIGQLARCVQTGNTRDLEKALHSPEIHYQEHWSPSSFENSLTEAYAAYFGSSSPREAWQNLGQFMVLCALKKTSRGTEVMNQTIESILRKQQLIGNGTWYTYRPVMITRNDYVHQLFNGDMGVTWKGPEGMRVYFQRADGQFKSFHPAQLGAHSTAWAMTVHKSQGSEFNHAFLVLPEVKHPLVTRELIYTGLTRARERVSIWSDLEVLKAGIRTPLQRYSGLVEKLR